MNTRMLFSRAVAGRYFSQFARRELTDRREITLDIVAIDGPTTLDFVKKYT